MSMLIGKVEPGDVIGRCRILRELGRGGVGTVYLAKHQTLQIEVALKVLSPTLSLEQPALAERFIREAQLAARIRHPNVIAVMDAAHDEPTGLYYIVLEYVGGGALAWHLRNGPLPEPKAMNVMIGIAQALVVAEENNIVHRDIKPENIMLDARGAAKLADLGLAKHDLDSRTSLTLGGSYMGTPAYMSPEQARDAKAADTRDDIYSLGATFYECLTGEAPFKGDTPYNIMSELLTKPSPKASDRNPEVSRCADMICRKMMAKTRGLRYGDARALLRDLQQAQLHGDGAFDRLEAARFARDTVMARQQALQHGVHAADPVLPGHPAPGAPASRPVRRLARASRSEDEGAFRAAVWLVVLVCVATGLFVLAGRHTLLSEPLVSTAVATKPVAFAPVKKKKLVEHVASVPKPKPEPPTPRPDDTAPKVAVNDITPRALPAEPAVVTNPPPGVPAPLIPPPDATNIAAAPVVPIATAADLTNAGYGIPPVPVVATPQTAFQARGVAEASLNPSLVGPGGDASLLKIIGRRSENSPVPRSWTFYFYDTSATGNATYRTVRNGRITRDGEAITVAVFPWHQSDVIDEGKLKIDSDSALAAAQALIPNTLITSSQLELRWPKDSTAPIWFLTLWARDRDGQEVGIGTVQVLADTGYVVRKNLTLPGA
jgi:hypothetical protein